MRVGRAEAYQLAHILLPFRARVLIRVEQWAWSVHRWSEAKLWAMELERVSRRDQKPAWRGKLVRRNP